MKIGILSFWNVPNYGSFLQAYALQNAISKLRPNDDVRQIAYLNQKHFDTYYAIFNKKYYLGCLDPRWYLNAIKRKFNGKIAELKPFINYYNDYIKHTDTFTATELENEPFDTIVLGSDIVWDYSIDFFGNDKHLFGNSLKSNNIISYAASFGTIKDTVLCPPYIKEGLNKLKHISVRDQNSQHIIKQYLNKDSEIVCDPTFIWDFATDKNITDIKEHKYIVVYGSYFNNELIKGCVEYAKNNHLKIICLDSLNDTFNWCDETVKQNKLNPFQWLSYFKNAECIFTCTYHGLMFGLIFKKRIVFSPTQFIMDKASSLISYLSLNDVLVSYNTFEQKAEWCWDYTNIDNKIDDLKQKSLDYLDKSL